MVNYPVGSGGSGGSGGGGTPPSRPAPKGGGVTVLNPPFDPRIRAVGDPSFKPVWIRRGWMQNPPGQSPQGSGVYRINFMFNPSDVQVNHTSTGIPATTQQRKDNLNRIAGDNPVYVDTGASVAFSLLFDRTYELWEQRRRATAANTFGVFSDVAAFYYYLGLIDNQIDPGQIGPGHISFPGDPAPPVQTVDWQSYSPNSPMVYFPSYIYIGPKLFFYGACNSFNVDYSHWNNAMTPQRCKVDLSFTIWASPAVTKSIQGNEGGGGSSSGSSGSSQKQQQPQKPPWWGG